MRSAKSLVPVVLACALTIPLPVLLAKASIEQAPAASQEVAEARKALAAGDLEGAFKLASSVLSRTPGDRGAAEVKVTVLLRRDQPAEALGAYDAYIAALRKPDQELLKTIAVSDLYRIVRVRSADRSLVAGALERLARGGDAGAMRTLKDMAASGAPQTPEGLAPVLSLAKLADAQTRANLGGLLEAAPPESRILLIKTLQDAGATAQAPAVAARLDDSEPGVRAAAAVALGILQYRPALPKLQAMFAGDLPIVRMHAALALKRLGDPAADSFVAGLLKSEIPDVRLMAAEAFQGARSQEWLALVRALGNDTNQAVRIRAATVMACCDAAAARAILVANLSGPPVARFEAARVMEEKGLGDATLARRLLGDDFDPVRMAGAGMAVAPSRSPR